jgi:hypothetical protein
MTPDQQGYLPCPTCGVLAPEGRPHDAGFCERALSRLGDGVELYDAPSTGPEPVTVDVEALWGGGT